MFENHLLDLGSVEGSQFNIPNSIKRRPGSSPFLSFSLSPTHPFSRLSGDEKGRPQSQEAPHSI